MRAVRKYDGKGKDNDESYVTQEKVRDLKMKREISLSRKRTIGCSFS